MDEQGTEHAEEVHLEPAVMVRNRRPKALWAVLAVVAVAAGALVVTSANDDGDQRPGLPVDLASQPGAGPEAAAADASMRAWVTYVPGDDLPALGGEATAYRLNGEVDEAQVRALAGALGIDGDVQSGDAGSWSVVGDDGMGHLQVYAGSGAAWSYYAGGDCVAEEGGVVACSASGSSGSAGSIGSGTATSCDGSAPECTVTTTLEAIDPVDSCIEASDDVAVDCAAAPPGTPPPCPPNANCVTLENCTTPDGTASTCPDDAATTTPPEPLTGEDEARAAALEVVAASGADVDGARVSAQSGGDSRTWFVTVEPVVDGIPTGLLSYIEVSEEAVVTSGNGFFGQPEALGEYPLLDTRAVIDRANSQSGAGIEPALGAADDAISSRTGGDVPTTTVVTGADPCTASGGASDGCGTTGCVDCNDVGVVEESATTIPPCKVQADGREICEVDPCAPGSPADGTACPPTCPQAAASEDAVAPEDTAVGAPESIDCAPPPPTPGKPLPDPVPPLQPLEVVLVDAEPSLVLLPANDGSADAYLVPAYRFTIEGGGAIDLPAVADEALAGPATTETTVPDTAVTEPEPVPVPEPQPCEVLEEGDDTGTTHTIQTCPTPEQDTLEIGGKGYYVDIDTRCAGGTFVLASRVWITEDDAVAGWADPDEQFEGGTFTLDAEDHGTFVGDAAKTKVAEFRTLGPAEDIFCAPEPRG